MRHILPHITFGSAVLAFTLFHTTTGKAAAGETKPISIEVVDQDTGKPIPEFQYHYRVRTPGIWSHTDMEDWRSCKSAGKALEVRVPVSCQIRLQVKAREYLGYHPDTFDVKTTDKDRTLLVKLRRGIIVKGTVRNARTKQPVKNARVIPYGSTQFPFSHPDEDRAVLSGEKGDFQLFGVDSFLGILVRHPEYIDVDARIDTGKDKDSPKNIDGKEILLEPGEVLEGKVTAPDGKAIQDVEVSTGSGKRARTDKKGTFVLRGLPKWWQRPLGLELSKEGYLKQTVGLVDRKSPQTIVLEPMYELRGRVVTPDGKAVRQYSVTAGPGRNPPGYRCVEAEIADGDKGFVLRLDSPGIHWIGVRAKGHAAWEGWAEVGRKKDALTITLVPGVTVTGKVKLPRKMQSAVEASLTPVRPDGWEVVVGIGACRATVKTDGAFMFEHVRPDDYLLTISGKKITRHDRALKVRAAGAEAGVIALKETGRIVGQAFFPNGEARSFAEIEVHRAEARGRNESIITVIADEAGRFTVEGVPAGDNEVWIPYYLSHFVDYDIRHARVLPAQTTVVHFLTGVGKVDGLLDDVVFEILVGDGSQKQFRIGTGMAARKVGDEREPEFEIRLKPIANRPASFPVPGWYSITNTGSRRITMPDVSAGKYRVVVGDYHMGPWFSPIDEIEVEVGPRQRFVRLVLGGGSVTGKVKWSVERRYAVQALAIAEGGKTVRSAHCDNDNGHFCMRCLTPGKWTFYAQDDKAGWCRLGTAIVKNDTTDLGEHKLGPGGTIAGKVDLGKEGQLPDALVAVHSNGIQIEAEDFSCEKQKEFSISNLWPGRWTLKLLRGDTVLATGTVELAGRETARVDLRVGSGALR